MNPKGRLYVGKTYNLTHRKASHKCASKNGGQSIILHNSIRKYGWENHFLEVIEEVQDEILNEREMFWIATLKTYCYENNMGMNMTRGGDGNRGSWMHDVKRRKQMSERFSGDKNPFFGKSPSAEARSAAGAKISKINKEKGQTVPKWGAEKSYEKSRRPIVVYNKSGQFLAEFSSISETARNLNISTGDVWSVINNKQQHASQMFFFYKTDNYPLKIDVSVKVFKRMKSPVLLLGENKIIIKEYSSAKEASNELKVPEGNITRAAKNYKGRPIRSGHIFVYKDEYKVSNQLN